MYKFEIGDYVRLKDKDTVFDGGYEYNGEIMKIVGRTHIESEIETDVDYVTEKDNLIYYTLELPEWPDQLAAMEKELTEVVSNGIDLAPGDYCWKLNENGAYRTIYKADDDPEAVFTSKRDAETVYAKRKLEWILLDNGGRREFKFGEPNVYVYVGKNADGDLLVCFSEEKYNAGGQIYFNSISTAYHAAFMAGDILIFSAFGFDPAG